MTIAELDALLERFSPSKQPIVAGRDQHQGRAVVMDKSIRRVTTAGVTTVTAGAPAVTHYSWESKRRCGCGCGQWVYGRMRLYFSNACKQKAYRQRKKRRQA